MKKYDTIRLTTACHEKAKEIDYKVPHFKPGKEIVDMSMFQPISETIKRLNGSRELTGDEVKMYYDFSSGSDNHAEIPFHRTAENLDLAILSSHIADQQKNIKGKINEGTKEFNELQRREKARQQRIAEITGKTSNNAE